MKAYPVGGRHTVAFGRKDELSRDWREAANWETWSPDLRVASALGVRARLSYQFMLHVYPINNGCERHRNFGVGVPRVCRIQMSGLQLPASQLYSLTRARGCIRDIAHHLANNTLQGITYQ